MEFPSQSEALSKLRELDGFEFEQLVADVWEKKDWETRVTPQSNDRGIDVIAIKEDTFRQKILIQAKKYGENTTVGSPEVREYHSLRHQEDHVDAVVIVTTSTFTSEAKQIADKLNVKLVDGLSFYNMLKSIPEDLLYKYVDLDKPISNSSIPVVIKEGNHDNDILRCPICNSEIENTSWNWTKHSMQSEECRKVILSNSKPEETPFHWFKEKFWKEIQEEIRNWYMKQAMSDWPTTEKALGLLYYTADDISHHTPNAVLNDSLEDYINKIDSINTVDEIKDIFRNWSHGIGINAKHNKIRPDDGYGTLCLITDETIIGIVGQNNKDVLIEANVCEIKHSKYIRGFRKNRVEIMLSDPVRIEETGELAESIHLWMSNIDERSSWRGPLDLRGFN